ncbi:MAG: hypothetical protein ACM3ZR_09040 [Pseudomonadota bacterium]
MKNIFYRPERVDTYDFDNIISKLREDLSELVSGKVAQHEIFEYAKKLLTDGKPLERDPEMIFWGLDKPENMPGDARVYYFYTPTYIAVSILAYIRLHYPETAGELKSFDDILGKGLNASTGRDFLGHGHDDLRGLIDCLDIFATADVFGFAEKHPDICPKFADKLVEAQEYLEHQLATGKKKGDWGEDYSEEASAVVRKIRNKD